MDDVEVLTSPDDLVEALIAIPNAAENFAASGDSHERNVLRWIKLAKTPPTRAKRILKAAEFAATKKKLSQM